ncbi:MAG: LptF/LptG family permease, partial [Nitrospinota bacterium]
MQYKGKPKKRQGLSAESYRQQEDGVKIERYLTREFGRWFLVGLCLFVVLSLVIEFFEKIDDLIDYHASVQLSLSYFAYRALLFLLQFVPLAVLFATLVTLILWSRSGELLALLSCGISPRQIALPFLFAAMLFS